MKWFRRKPKEEPDVYFRWGRTGTWKEGVYLGDTQDGQRSLVRLTKSDYPWLRGEILSPQKCNIVQIKKENDEYN